MGKILFLQKKIIHSSQLNELCESFDVENTKIFLISYCKLMESDIQDISTTTYITRLQRLLLLQRKEYNIFMNFDD